MSDLYTTFEQQASYGIGRQLADQLSNKPFAAFDNGAALAGFTDSLHGQSSQVSPDQINQAFQQIQKQIKQEQAEQAKTLGAEGEKFLLENAKRDEITETESGLQYEVITQGNGEKPSLSSTVRTHYHGTLIDGTVFDSSYDRGEPAEFPVSGVIAGWTEALQEMAVGTKWRLYVPYNLAYGENGAGGAIGPFATLIFDVELLEIIS